MTTFAKTDQSISNLQDTMWEWMTDLAPAVLALDPVDYSTIPWIMAFQTGSLPARPFGTIFIKKTMPMMTMQNTTLKWDEGQDAFNESTQTPMEVEIELSMFGENAVQYLMKLVQTVSTQQVKDLFYTRGIRYNSHSEMKVQPKLPNKQYEDRAHIVFKMFTIYENISLVPGVIQVTVDGEIDQNPIQPITVKIE